LHNTRGQPLDASARWGSWITCEETNAGSPPWGKQHGYAFDVPAGADETVPAVAIPDMGRFSHEAVAVDPNTLIVYETEDNGENSGLYRFIANTPGRLTDGGRLQMLAINGIPQYNTITDQTVGAKLPVTWVDIANPNPPGTTSTAVFNQGLAAGGARFARLEGIWYGNSSLFFNSTSGGEAGEGQVWEYHPDNSGGGFLRLVFESPDALTLNAPDNIAVSPKGALILCEDGDDDQFLRVVTKQGGIFDFALNLENGSEWAGATFAIANVPGSVSDRTTLFVNRQGETTGPTPPAPGDDVGMTFAIWGPWNKGAL
jgi:secreted PhoX family phosphatase